MKSKITLSVLTAFLSVIAFAQDTASSVNVTTTQTETATTTTATSQNPWYTQPWVWLLGAALLVLILIALLKGKRSDTSRVSVTETRTVKRDGE